MGLGDGPIILYFQVYSTFLKNNSNSNLYLADKFLSYEDDDKLRVITKGETILSNDENISLDNFISQNSAEEADQNLIRDMT